MCITTMTDEELTNDDEDKMEKGEQGGGKAIHARYGNRVQAMTEKDLRRAEGRELRKVRGLRWEDHDAEINQTIEESYHCSRR